jgi:cell division protein FtsB
MEIRQRALIRVAAVVLLTLALVYVAKLAGLSLDTHRAQDAEAKLSAEVTQMATSVEALETAVIEAESDEFVEDWAREDREWVREGDQPIDPQEVPVGTTGAAGTTEDERSAWERLKAWIRGEGEGDGETESAPDAADGG